MLKLLSKSEIDTAKNLDRSREVAEGLKLSRRVDGLRELASKEEQMLEKHRTETLASISKEISDLNADKEVLLAELISRFQFEYQHASPLDPLVRC